MLKAIFKTPFMNPNPSGKVCPNMIMAGKSLQKEVGVALMRDGTTRTIVLKEMSAAKNGQTTSCAVAVATGVVCRYDSLSSDLTKVSP